MNRPDLPMQPSSGSTWLLSFIGLLAFSIVVAGLWAVTDSFATVAFSVIGAVFAGAGIVYWTTVA